MSPDMAFKPAWWLPSPHLQTLWPVFFRNRSLPDLAPERLELDDGDFIDLCWSRNANKPVVLILHGLEGSIQSHYAGALMQTLEQAAYRPVFMHFRGCSGEPNRLARSYHSGDTADLARVADHINGITGTRLHAVIGFSLGGNVLLKWLGQSGHANTLQSAVAVSVPFMLADAASRMAQGFSHMYERHLIKSLKRSYLDKFKRIESPLEVEIGTLNSFWSFDDSVTAPLHGFRDVEHYYGESSCRQYLSGIQVPTRIIHALDDPFMFPETVPGEDELGENVELLLTRHGGHVGFVSGRYPWRAEYWHESKIIEFLRQSEQ
ncbi:MAG: hydrolase [Gammaproteobacteria bacterium]|nr:hydrolase [Gammaproteobacteria bacterium]